MAHLFGAQPRTPTGTEVEYSVDEAYRNSSRSYDIDDEKWA